MRRLITIALLGLLTAGCAGDPPDRFQVGMKQIALSLRFSNPELQVPPDPIVIVERIPAPPELVANPSRLFTEDPVDDSDSPGFEAPSRPLRACPVAAPGSNVDVPVANRIVAPTPPGSYPRHNEGTVTISGIFNITVPYPVMTEWEVSEAVTRTLPGVPPTEELITGAAPGAFGGDVQEWDVTKKLTPEFTIIDRYQLRPTGLLLAKRSTVTRSETTTFEPTPPVEILRFGYEGTTWRSSGIDVASGTGMLFDGIIAAREVVDVCGRLVDAYRVDAVENVVNLATGESQGNDSASPNRYYWAPQYGGLVVREDVSFTANLTDPSTKAPIVVTYDYISTIDRLDPEP